MSGDYPVSKQTRFADFATFIFFPKTRFVVFTTSKNNNINFKINALINGTLVAL